MQMRLILVHLQLIMIMELDKIGLVEIADTQTSGGNCVVPIVDNGDKKILSN